MDAEDWIGFTRHFVHLKDDQPAKDKTLLWHDIQEAEEIRRFAEG